MFERLKFLVDFVNDAIPVVEGVLDKVRDGLVWLKNIINGGFIPHPVGAAAPLGYDELLNYAKEMDAIQSGQNPQPVFSSPGWLPVVLLSLLETVLNKLIKK